MIQYSSRRRWDEGVGHPGVEGGVNALLDHNEDQLGLVVGEGLEALDQLRYLILLHHPHLTLGHAVPVDHNLVRQAVVYLHKRRHVTEVTGGGGLIQHSIFYVAILTQFSDVNYTYFTEKSSSLLFSHMLTFGPKTCLRLLTGTFKHKRITLILAPCPF